MTTSRARARRNDEAARRKAAAAMVHQDKRWLLDNSAQIRGVIALWAQNESIQFLLRWQTTRDYNGNFSLMDAALEQLWTSLEGHGRRTLRTPQELAEVYPAIWFIHNRSVSAWSSSGTFNPRIMPSSALLPDGTTDALRRIWQFNYSI